MLNEKLLSVEELEERTGLPRSWFYAAAEAGRLPSLKVGRYVRFVPSEVEAWLEAQRRQPPGAER